MGFFDDLLKSISGNPLGAVGTGLGAIGALSSDSMSPEQREIYDMLKKRMQGIDPKLLERMRSRARSAVGNEASALRSSTAARLNRQNAPVAKQEEVLAKIRSQGIGGIDDALLGVDELNERVKQGAAGNLASFNTQSNEGQGFADLFGSGLNSLMNKPKNNNFNPEFGYQMDQIRKRGRNFEQFKFPRSYNVDRFQSTYGG
jgi:hypothetical protein